MLPLASISLCPTRAIDRQQLSRIQPGLLVASFVLICSVYSCAECTFDTKPISIGCTNARTVDVHAPFGGYCRADTAGLTGGKWGSGLGAGPTGGIGIKQSSIMVALMVRSQIKFADDMFVPAVPSGHLNLIVAERSCRHVQEQCLSIGGADRCLFYIRMHAHLHVLIVFVHALRHVHVRLGSLVC